jgi:hypothetical protein
MLVRGGLTLRARPPLRALSLALCMQQRRAAAHNLARVGGAGHGRRVAVGEAAAYHAEVRPTLAQMPACR